MKKEMTTDECLEIFKKYDMELYNYYHNNMWYFGWEARRYAAYLKRNNEGDANLEPCDSTAHGDVMIEGKCQNIDEWLERGV